MHSPVVGTNIPPAKPADLQYLSQAACLTGSSRVDWRTPNARDAQTAIPYNALVLHFSLRLMVPSEFKT